MLQRLLKKALSLTWRAREVSQTSWKVKSFSKKLKLNLAFRVSSLNYNKKSFILPFIALVTDLREKKTETWIVHEARSLHVESHSSQFIPFCSYLLLFRCKAHYGLIVSFQSKHGQLIIQGFVWCFYFSEIFLLLLNRLCCHIGWNSKSVEIVVLTSLIILCLIQVTLWIM